jgi:hypothetical protein
MLLNFEEETVAWKELIKISKQIRQMSLHS